MSTTQQLQGRRALVVGGASGIGRATALVLARAGAEVAVADRDDGGAVTAAAAIRAEGGTATTHHLDVTSEADWAALAAELLPAGRHLDVAVNSAGVSFSRPVTEMTLAEWDRVLAVNLSGVFLGTQFALRAMLPRGEGTIINVSSSAGIKAIPGASAYAVSKAGVCMLTRVAAHEAAQAGSRVRVNAVLPGGVKTPLWRQMDFFKVLASQAGGEEAAFGQLGQHVPLKRYAEPEEVARAILYLASDESSYVTGTDFVIDGGWTA